MSHFPIQTQRDIIGRLPVGGYGSRVRRFAIAVTQLAEELVTQHHARPCSLDDDPTSHRPPIEGPLRGARWTLKGFIRRHLKHMAPELATLPIRYAPQSPSTRATYSPSEDTIFVGNDIIREIRTKRFVSVLSTLHHEKTHRDSEMRHRTITEPLVNAAITLAAESMYNPDCAPEVFRQLAERQLWWEDDHAGGREFVNHEDELYARITQLAFRSTRSNEQLRTLHKDIATYEAFVHAHIAGIANRFSPLVAGIVLGYVEETVKADIPGGYTFLTSNMTSDAHYIQIRAALESYKSLSQVCQQQVLPTCDIPSRSDGRLMAEPRYQIIN